MTRTFILFALIGAPIVCGGAFAQSTNAFTPGNLVVSRSVYTGSAATLAVGQALPPVCPSTAACGTGVATDNGAYASTTAANNVFNNDAVDGSFGVTSPIFLDEITPAGTVVTTTAIPTSMVTTSFSSKSELALNLSTDGTAITFMAYVAAPNTVDVSNSNSPGAYDPTNPAGGSYYRAVVEIGANGAIRVTPTNSYSGNNGRAAILANGVYYMTGNANNGAGTPANVQQTEGVQLAIPGQSFGTPAIHIGNFSISQVTNSATGLPYPADKTGKDNNFRGLTIFNNTLYVTKGSGGNGINTVYQVGDAGSLPTPSNAASAAITILNGFPATLAKASGAANPFGIFFANATTLYVADEGDGTAADPATSANAGLQKWVFANGAWSRAYVLQNGLNLGQQFSVANYPSTLNPANDGLRNIAGQVNSDGTVTIWAVTSTLSANGDQGADPNQLVSITDTLANTSAAAAASETFKVLMTASAGQVLRGVSFAPTAGATPAVNVPLIQSAANPASFAIAPGSIAIAGGQNLGPLDMTASTTSVSITDGQGGVTAAPILSVAPEQIVFYLPASVAEGTATVTITTGASTQTAANVEIANVAPAIFTINGSGLAEADVVQVDATGAETFGSSFMTNSDGADIAAPIAVGSGAASTYLVLYGTGIGAGGTALTAVSINGSPATVIYAGSSGANNGLDQVNVLLPGSLSGTGNVDVQLTVEGVPANPVQITVQ